jgi:hypothetical protein
MLLDCMLTCAAEKVVTLQLHNLSCFAFSSSADSFIHFPPLITYPWIRLLGCCFQNDACLPIFLD